MRPLIAVTGVPITPGGVLGWSYAALACPAAYLEALDRAGADGAVLMPAVLDAVEATRRLSPFAGLIAVGGADVDPACYGEKTQPEVVDASPLRDGFEIPLLRGALSAGLPTLAICRGVQVLNVALGGTLHQHISDREDLLAHRSPDGAQGVLHPVRIEAGSRLAKAMGVERAEGFSHHHQALSRLGERLRPVAWSEDGLVEAVEREEGWVVGIQWHAEATAGADPAQQGVFDALVERAGGR